jgi:hypothetical protein
MRDEQPQQEGRVKSWFLQMAAEVEAQRAQEQARRDEKARTAAKAARERLTPLDERLTRLLATIPLDVQREGLSLPTLRASLRGRSRGNCHPGELGAAMRRLGFERRRNWCGGQGGFPAIWCKVR